MIEPFFSRPSPKIIFGPDALNELPACVREVDGTAVFLVSDQGISKAGHLDTARKYLESAGIGVTIFDGTKENPTEEDAAACCAIARQARFDCFVALGGGSSMDTAKACNFLLTNGGVMRDYHGYGQATKPMLPLIAIPTTSGTGSECQSYALVSRSDTHEKMACGDTKARARIAILDPNLTATQPKSVAMLTGLDALAHAVESAVCTKRNAISSLYSEHAFRHLSGAIGPVMAGEASADDRGHMQLGAALGGLAIENSMLGAAHATANPLTARYAVVHGHAVATMLPHVMRWNAQDRVTDAIYTRFSEILRSSGVTALDVIAWVSELVERVEIPFAVIPAVALPGLAEEAAKQWTSQFNPRALQRDNYVALYRRALRIDGPV